MEDYKTTTVHQPAILISDADLDLAMDQPVEFPAYLFHTQTVERAVNFVTDAASPVEGEASRHGHILSVLAAESQPGKILQLRGNTSTRLSRLSKFILPCY